MSPRFVLVLAICALGFVLVTTDALPALVDVVARGRRLSVDADNPDGVTLTRVDDLVAQAAAVVGRPVDRDAYSLARVCRSEEGKLGQIAKNALCHVVMTQADALGWEITYTVLYHKTSSRSDHYGAQMSGRVASGVDPYESDLAAAEHAMAERAAGLDPTSGATNFVDRRAFGVQDGTGSFAELVDTWAADGKTPGTLPGISEHLVFFWRGGGVPPQATPVTA